MMGDVWIININRMRRKLFWSSMISMVYSKFFIIWFTGPFLCMNTKDIEKKEGSFVKEKQSDLVIKQNKNNSNNTKQFCDVLAKNCGYKVVMPDFFRGEPYKHEWMGDLERLMAWIGKVGSLEVVSF